MTGRICRARTFRPWPLVEIEWYGRRPVAVLWWWLAWRGWTYW
jgi:hypothetical protein